MLSQLLTSALAGALIGGLAVWLVVVFFWPTPAVQAVWSFTVRKLRAVINAMSRSTGNQPPPPPPPPP